MVLILWIFFLMGLMDGWIRDNFVIIFASILRYGLTRFNHFYHCTDSVINLFE